MNEKYYIFITPDNTIWGVGQTRPEAIEDGKKNLLNYYEIGELPKKGKVLQATSELAWTIWDNGYEEDMWDLEKNGEMWLAKLKDNRPVNYYKRITIKETTLKY